MIDVERRTPLPFTTHRAVTVFGAVALVAFLCLAYLVTHGSALTRMDLRDFDRRQSAISATGTPFWVALSLVGSPASMTLLAVLGALWLGWHRRIRMLVVWASAFAGASLLVVALKRTIHRARPDGAELFLHGTSLSFPSGHAVGSVVGLGMLTYLLAVYRIDRPMHRSCLVLIAAGTVSCIAYSRLYLGVHYLSDVIAGLLLGAVWLLVCVQASEFAYRRTARHHA